MTRFTCYACDGDFNKGFWVDTGEPEKVFYCVSCGIQNGLHESVQAQPEGEITIWQAWLHDILLGEGATAEEAIEAAVAEYERAIGYGEDPHLYANKEALVEDLDVGPSEDWM